MPKKAAKTKKSATVKTPAKHQHVRTPWLKLKQMWESGQSYEAMAKATDAHYDPKKPDPTKATRAKIWKARNHGVHIDGKLVKFGQRGKTGNGKGKKAKPSEKAGSGTAKKGKTSEKAKGGSEKVKAKAAGKGGSEKVKATKAEAPGQPVRTEEPAKKAEQV